MGPRAPATNSSAGGRVWGAAWAPRFPAGTTGWAEVPLTQKHKVSGKELNPEQGAPGCPRRFPWTWVYSSG